jgi:vacuolar-type H+-ATPase subunit F/Vma7
VRAIFIGPEADAAGFRLAGLEVRVPEAGAESAALAAARERAEIVFISAGTAARIPEAEMRAAICALAPITGIVPELLGTTPLPDVAARLRRELGLEG